MKDLNKALQIFHNAKRVCLGYVRDVSYTLTNEETGQAVIVVDEQIYSANKSV